MHDERGGDVRIDSGSISLVRLTCARLEEFSGALLLEAVTDNHEVIIIMLVLLASCLVWVFLPSESFKNCRIGARKWMEQGFSEIDIVLLP